MIAPHRSIAASRENYNTEIGLPLEILAAPWGTEVLVLELAMRGLRPDPRAGGDLRARRRRDHEHRPRPPRADGLARGRRRGEGGAARRAAGGRHRRRALRRAAARAVAARRPRGRHLRPRRRRPLRGRVAAVRRGPGRAADPARGDRAGRAGRARAARSTRSTTCSTRSPRWRPRGPIGVHPSGKIDVRFSSMRGERVAVGIGAVVINDCYNANPLSMRAALDDLASHHAEGRRVAVLGDMLELGPAEREHHREIGAYAASAGRRPARHRRPARRRHARHVRRRVARGARTPARPPRCCPSSSTAGDVVLVKASRGVGLEVVTEALQAAG